MNRRRFLAAGTGAVGGLILGGCTAEQRRQFGLAAGPKQPFRISLAEWSLHRRLFGRAEPKLEHLDFAATARQFGIDAVEYVNQFFKDKAKDKKYLARMKKRAADNGVKSLLIMCDGEGALGDADGYKRREAVENHYKWVEAAKYLGCHSIRVNASSQGSYDEQLKRAAMGLHSLSEFAAAFDINVLVENHGGLSSDPEWLTAVIKQVNLPNCGTLPDFGNFPAETDHYEAVEKLMPYAKAVSAKSYEFDDHGSETRIDYHHMMKVVTDAGYDGYVGIEYEGQRLSEAAGILATKRLLEEVRAQYTQG